jgi:hypothetical protein
MQVVVNINTLLLLAAWVIIPHINTIRETLFNNLK